MSLVLSSRCDGSRSHALVALINKVGDHSFFTSSHAVG
jgi:hypothetical protein